MAYRVTLIPGDGTGPELAAALETVIAASGVAIDWERHDAGAAVLERRGTPLPDEVVASVRDTGVAIKGPITTPVGSGFRSVNVALRKELDLYAAVRPARSLPGVPSRFAGVDLVVVRENTEDLYAGVEREVTPGVAESIKIITRRRDRARRALRLRLGARPRPSPGHGRPQGQHHEAHRRAVPAHGA